MTLEVRANIVMEMREWVNCVSQLRPLALVCLCIGLCIFCVNILVNRNNAHNSVRGGRLVTIMNGEAKTTTQQIIREIKMENQNGKPIAETKMGNQNEKSIWATVLARRANAVAMVEDVVRVPHLENSF